MAAEIRAQYHFRPSDEGLLAWDVRRLVRLSQDLPVRRVALSEIAEIDENHWFAYGDQHPTCRSIVEHARLINACDLQFPIILDQNGRVMDGMHRVCKALMKGDETVLAVQFEKDPEPDFIGRQPAELPYED
ncbi:MAG: hypothetical protein AAGF58_13860 [Pseudomonadota bacterium]